jgi:hypothetical protein
MGDSLTREEEFLLKEYDSAIQMTFHVDELRSKFTNLFITITGAAAVALSLFIQGDVANSVFGKFEFLLGLLLLLIAIIGILVVIVIARLRKVQLENFRITNNIRRYFIKENYDLWDVVELSKKTLPKPNRHSGTYYWLMVLILLNSYIMGMAVYLFSVMVWKLVLPTNGFFLAIIGAGIFLILQDFLYFQLANPPPPPDYSKENPPDGNMDQHSSAGEEPEKAQPA